MNYIPLHVHYSKGSIGDSILKTKDAVKKAKELNINALAVTDHGSMSNVISFYKECINNNIKPLIGLEAYECDNRLEKDKKYNHLILLAKNKEGYKDLLNISNDASINGFYYRPRTDINILKKYGKNLIALSACISGRIPKLILDIFNAKNEKYDNDYLIEELKNNNLDYKDNNIINEYIKLKYNQIINIINEYKNIFYDFYLELQPGNFKEQIIVNKALVLLSKITNTKLVITNDVHYLNKEDYKIHDCHVKITKKKKIDDNMIYPDTCYYLMSCDEIRNMFPYLDNEIINQAIKNTENIANEINLDDLYNGKIKMPNLNIPKMYNNDSYLSILSKIKLKEKNYNPEKYKIYYERMEYELNVLKEVGFSGYFLVIKDICDYANKNDILIGPGRGSVCSSLIAYLIGITKVDPIKYNLNFARFISKHRKGSVPDVDLDIESSKRIEIFNYVVNKYGNDHCALVSTFTNRKARSAIKDTARIYNIDIDTADYVAKLIPEIYYDSNGDKNIDVSIHEALEINKELKDAKENNKDWFNSAEKLENIERTTSIHAAGTLISSIPLNEYIPLIRNNTDNKDMLATSLDLSDSEYAGAIKYDFLALNTLDIIKATEKDTGFIMDFDNDELLNDKKVWDTINNHSDTLFQISSDTYKKRMHKLNVCSIKELANCLALVRGPCISSKLDKVYIDVVQKNKEIELIHPFYDSVTNRTNGVLLFQEQTMQILQNFGMTEERSFQIMKYASKKKTEQIKEAEKEFIKLSIQNNIEKNKYEKIWSIILDTGKYSFNESHAIAYALICYYTAYLKTYYPTYWMKNVLSNYYINKKKEISEVIQECRRMGIIFSGLDINKSSYMFKVENDNTIRIGFCAIPGLGYIAYEQIKNKKFASLKDFIESINGKFNKNNIILSIFGGAFDCFYNSRIECYDEYCILKKIKDKEDKIKISKDNIFNIEDDIQDIESKIYGLPLYSNPVNNFEKIDINKLNSGKSCYIKAVIRKIKKIKDKNGNNMAFITLETINGYMNGVVFSNVYQNINNKINKNAIINAMVKKNKDSLIIEKVTA